MTEVTLPLSLLASTLSLALGALMTLWKAAEKRREEQETESRKSQGERIGRLEAQVTSLSMAVTELKRDQMHCIQRTDETMGAVHEMTAHVRYMGERLAATTGRTTQSSGAVPQARPPLKSRP